MSRKFAVLIVCGVLACGCGQSTVKNSVPIAADGLKGSATVATSGSPANGSFSLEDFVVGEPVRFENLTIFPVASRVPKTDDRFITLDEGLKAGTVEIHELSAAAESVVAEHASHVTSPSDQASTEPNESILVQGDISNQSNVVNTLIVVNHSDKPLYLMPGEVIIGGSQDRTIGEELVIAAQSPPTKVPVFCVEHGRWGTKGIEETLQQLQVAGSSRTLSDSVSLSMRQTQSLSEVAEDADKGKFVASVGQLGKSARMAVQSDKDQSAVWQKVAETNAKSGVQTVSDAFTANYSNAETVKRLEPYLENLQASVAKHDQVVGVVVAINGKIESIDVFESTPLFQKIWPKLLKSYSLDAMNGVDDLAEKPAECTRNSALTFFAETLNANVASADTEQGVGLVKRDGQHVLSFTSHVDAIPAPAAMGGGMGGMGGGMGNGVHFSGFAK